MLIFCSQSALSDAKATLRLDRTGGASSCESTADHFFGPKTAPQCQPCCLIPFAGSETRLCSFLLDLIFLRTANVELTKEFPDRLVHSRPLGGDQRRSEDATTELDQIAASVPEDLNCLAVFHEDPSVVRCSGNKTGERHDPTNSKLAGGLRSLRKFGVLSYTTARSRESYSTSRICLLSSLSPNQPTTTSDRLPSPKLRNRLGGVLNVSRSL